jgi:hypothetical protein
LSSIQTNDRKGGTTNKDNHDLTAHNDKLNADKPIVLGYAFEDIDPIVQSTRAVKYLVTSEESKGCDVDLLVHIENLHPDEGVENEGAQLGFCESQDAFTAEIQDQRHYKLVDGLSDNHFPHRQGYQRSRLRFWLSSEQAWRRRIGGEGESCKSVHDQVHPKKLNGLEDGAFIITSDSGNEGEYNRRNVDGDLKLVKGQQIW